MYPRVSPQYYLTREQHEQVVRLCAGGPCMSTIARQAIRKCNDVQLMLEDDTPRPKRVNLYLSRDAASLLEQVAVRDGCSKAQTLRKSISHTSLKTQLL